MPNLYKVGLTTNPIKQRIGELNTTGVPTSFIVEAMFEIEASSLLDVEQIAHKRLRADGLHRGKEFFEGRTACIKAVQAAIFEVTEHRTPDLVGEAAHVAARKSRQNEAAEEEERKRKILQLAADKEIEEERRLYIEELWRKEWDKSLMSRFVWSLFGLTKGAEKRFADLAEQKFPYKKVISEGLKKKMVDDRKRHGETRRKNEPKKRITEDFKNEILVKIIASVAVIDGPFVGKKKEFVTNFFRENGFHGGEWAIFHSFVDYLKHHEIQTGPAFDFVYRNLAKSCSLGLEQKEKDEQIKTLVKLAFTCGEISTAEQNIIENVRKGFASDGGYPGISLSDAIAEVKATLPYEGKITK